MIEAGRITQANRVRCCEHAEPAIWTDDAVLIEERPLPVCFQYALDNEHHIGTARIIFVKDPRDRMLKRPGKKAFLELRYLLSVFQDAGVPADQIDTAAMRIESDADARPVKPCRHLLDGRGLAGPVITLTPD